MSDSNQGLPGEIRARLEQVRSATASLTRAAESADPDAVAEAIRLRGEALDHLGAWFAVRMTDDPARALHRRIAGDLESSLVEARDALAQMRDAAKLSLDALRGTRAVRGYAGSDSSRKSAALDRAG